MSQEIPGNTRTFQAGGSINAFKVVRIGASDNVVHHNTSSTTVPVGISRHSASSGETVTVTLNGTAKVIAAAQIARGARVAADTGGAIRTTTTANDAVVGAALESSVQTVTVSGTEVIEVDLTPKGSNF